MSRSDSNVDKAKQIHPPLAPQRNLALVMAVAALAVVSILFYYQQNFAGQIGGKMSIAKLLWLDYALIAWFLLPFVLCRSPLVAPVLRWIYGAHLITFAVRGAAELWLLYVTVSWMPPYGITHDLIVIALITGFLWRERKKLRPLDDAANRAARRFLSSIRVGLSCEIVFAWLFYRATEGRIGIYFASTDPLFATINGLTWAAVLVLYPDLLRTLWQGRDALFPISGSRFAGAARQIHGSKTASL